MRILNLNSDYHLGSYHCEPGALFVLIRGKELTPLSDGETEAQRDGGFARGHRIKG